MNNKRFQYFPRNYAHLNSAHLNSRQQHGYILITVVITLFILASISLLLNRESSMGVSSTANDFRSSQAYYAAKAGINHSYILASSQCVGTLAPFTNTINGIDYTASVALINDPLAAITSTSISTTGEERKLIKTINIANGPSGTSAPTTVELAPQQDTHIREDTASTNYGNSIDLDVSITAAANRHSFLQFDFSNINYNAKINSVILQVPSSDSSGISKTVTLHRVTKAWTELESTWTNAKGSTPWTTSGGDYDPAIIATVATPVSTDDFVNFDITSLANLWHTGTPNYGVMLKTQTAATIANFKSRESTVVQRAKLLITYQCECSTTCITATSCDGVRSYQDNFYTNSSYIGSDGLLNWLTPWEETGETDGAALGSITVVNMELEVTNKNLTVERELDLSSASTATFEYNFKRSKLDNANDFVTVEVSANGSVGPWTILATYQGKVDDVGYTFASHDITAYISSNTRFRMKSSTKLGKTDQLYFDDVEIKCSP